MKYWIDSPEKNTLTMAYIEIDIEVIYLSFVIMLLAFLTIFNFCNLLQPCALKKKQRIRS